MRSQRSNFREIINFSTVQIHISKLLTVPKWNFHQRVVPINSELNDVLLRHLDRIFVTYNIPKEKNPNHAGNITRRQTGSKALIDIGNNNDAL